MQVEQKLFTVSEGWQTKSDKIDASKVNLVIFFGNRKILSEYKIYDDLKRSYPNASILGGSTGGEICDINVFDNSVVSSAISFDSTTVKCNEVNIKDPVDSSSIGQELGKSIASKELVHCFVLSDGLNVNGSALVDGIRKQIGNIAITGGLMGDGANFEETCVGLNSNPSSGKVVIVGFYGNSFRASHGSLGGWLPFGTERIITKSEGNILYELDNQPALDLYKKYLGNEVDKLPGSALLFPLSIRKPDNKKGMIVRTILSVDEDKQSMTFAGDIPEGHCAQLMRASFDELVFGAKEAAKQSNISSANDKNNLAILVSCIGRKLLMGQRVSYEIEAIREIFGPNVIISGFYSYGEISPHHETGICGLHNQTMTITMFSEN